MKSKSLLCIALVTCVTSILFAQNSPGLRTVIPPSPNATSLGKYGEVPVGYYTGIPNISIPLATIKSRELAVPVSISYHAGGIPVEEVASWVGLGWSLNAGGVIIRSVRGLPDDLSNGYFNTRTTMNALGIKYKDYVGVPNFFQEGGGNGLEADKFMYEQILAQVTDSEPDIFYFNFGSVSGKFFMNSAGNFIISPIQALKIEQVSLSTGVSRWTLTTPDGVKYIFGTTLDQSRSALEKTVNEASSVAASAWYLMEIVSPNNDRIDLYYTQENYNYQLKASETINRITFDGGNCDLPQFDKKIMINYFEGWRINRIQGGNGDILFNQASAQRNDLPGSYALASLHIRDAQSTILKKVNFSNSYFNATGNCPTGTSYCKRLKLDAVEELSPNELEHGAKHTFAYSPIELPSWDPYATSMNAQDMWGFFNGAVNSVLPRGGTINSSLGPSQTIFGANRYSDEHFMQACMLNKITYPTGGYSFFDFEANRLYTSDANLGNSNAEPVAKATSLLLQTGETKTQDFIVADPDPTTSMVRVTITNRQQIQNCAPGNCFQTYIEGRNSTTFQRFYFPEGTSTLDLYPGEYRIGGTTFPSYESIISSEPKSYYLNLSWLQYPTSTSLYAEENKIVGGLRIKRITNSSGSSPVNVKKYTYDKFSLSESSGVAVNISPLNADALITARWDAPSNSERSCSYVQCKSSTLIPLTPTSGAIIGYANVTELIGENGEGGKTEHVFTTALDYPDENKNFRPFPPAASFDWRRGLLLKKTSYANSQSGFVKVNEIENTYSFGNSPVETYGVVITKDYFGPANLTTFNNYYAAGYKTTSEFYYLQTEKLRSYDQINPTTFIEGIKTYEYGITPGHYQLTRATEVNSVGSIKETINKYPQDVVLSGDEETARQSLVNKFIINSILDQTTKLGGSQTTKITTGYKIFYNGLTLPSRISFQDGSGPLEERVNFINYDNFGNILDQAKTNDLRNAYEWGYNNSLPVAEVKNASNSKTVTNQSGTMSTNFGGAPGVSATYYFTVGYTGTVIVKLGVMANPSYSTVATITISGIGSQSLTVQKGGCALTYFTFSNVTPGDKTMTITLTTPDSGVSSFGVCGNLEYPETITTIVKEFYVENFEELPNAAIATPHTGKKYLNGDYSPQFQIPNGRSYIIEYWYLNLSGQWVYTTKPYTGTSILVNEGTAIDNVRIYPTDALMKSYTYDPVLGITSAIDENASVMFYDYDTFGRLWRVRNDKGGIEKQYTYNYKSN